MKSKLSALIGIIWFAVYAGLSTATPVFDVEKFGAISDGKFLCTTSIQSAIDACHQAGGGKVVLNNGQFLSGTLVLKDNVYLELSPGSTLLGSSNMEDYGPLYLLYAEDAKNFGITGPGTINGRGDFYWRGKERPYHRPEGTIKFVNCQDVLLKEFNLRNSPSWCVVVEECDRATITGLTIVNDREAPNTDGIDPVSSSNVFISDCYIDTGDDCICPKSNGMEKSCENLVVTNCVLISDDSAIKLGTRSDGYIRNCTFSNIVVRNTQYGIGFYMKDGGHYEDIQFSNISIETSLPDAQDPGKCTNSYAIFMDIEGRGEQIPNGSIRNVIFSDINIVTTDGNCLFAGMPDQYIKDVTLNNIRMRVLNRTDLRGRHKPRGTRSLTNLAVNDRSGISSHFTFAYIDGLNIRNFVIEDETPHNNFERSYVWGQNVKDVTISGFKNYQSADNTKQPLLYFENCNKLFLNMSQPGSPQTPFLSLHGAETRNVFLTGNDFSDVKQPVEYSNNVNKKQVQMINNRFK